MVARNVCWRGIAVRLPPVSKLEAVVESRVDLLERQHLHPRGGQLDGQRNAVEPLADADHRLGVLRRQREL